jgi:hypothetical protein
MVSTKVIKKWLREQSTDESRWFRLVRSKFIEFGAIGNEGLDKFQLRNLLGHFHIYFSRNKFDILWYVIACFSPQCITFVYSPQMSTVVLLHAISRSTTGLRSIWISEVSCFHEMLQGCDHTKDTLVRVLIKCHALCT